MKKKILFIATGGTISTEMDSKIQGYIAKKGGEDLISGIDLQGSPGRDDQFQEDQQSLYDAVRHA